jgi:hypothetical protein
MSIIKTKNDIEQIIKKLDENLLSKIRNFRREIMESLDELQPKGDINDGLDILNPFSCARSNQIFEIIHEGLTHDFNNLEYSVEFGQKFYKSDLERLEFKRKLHTPEIIGKRLSKAEMEQKIESPAL